MSLLSNRCLAGLGKNTVSAVSNKQPCLTVWQEITEQMCRRCRQETEKETEGRQEGAGMIEKTKQKKEREDK